MAGMVYLIITTQRQTIKIWNPYDILGISDVRPATDILKLLRLTC